MYQFWDVNLMQFKPELKLAQVEDTTFSVYTCFKRRQLNSPEVIAEVKLRLFLRVGLHELYERRGHAVIWEF